MKRRLIAMLLAFVMLVGMLPIQAFATEGEQTQCATEGCTYGFNHEGDCSNYVAPTEPCGTEGCTYGLNHEGDCSNYVAPTEPCGTEGCTYGLNHEGDCSNYIAPTDCETEGCTYAYGHEGDCSPVADQTAAQAVIDLINAIGEVTLDSETAISAADAAYNALTDTQKELVSNLDVLEAAKNSYSALSTAMTVEAAADAVVYVTVNNKGVLAEANDGSVMVNKAVTVKDANSDGYLTYDEALMAAHDAYCPGGYTSTEGAYGTQVDKLWGVSQGTNYLFFKNDTPLTMNVGDTTDSTVSAGDKLYVSVNADNTYYADWYTYFDKTDLTVDAGVEFTLTLKGYLGMGTSSTAEAVSGVTAGTWQSGSFTAIEGKTTDENGQVTEVTPKS